MAAFALAGCDRSSGARLAAADPNRAARDGADVAPPAAPAAHPAAPVQRPPSDSEITARAAAAMQRDPALAGADLSVSTNHGVVSLTGTVKSPEQMAAAEARAQSPSGVMRVETHVTVDPDR